MNSIVRFWVPGIPRPGGSKRAFYIPQIKRAVITEDCKRSKDWRASVGFMAAERIKTPFDAPIAIEFVFCMPRPRGHYGTGRNAHQVRASAPRWPGVKPDVTKLVRSTEDAMKGIAWRDDAQVVYQIARKSYAKQPGAWITIRVMDGTLELEELG